MAYNLTRDAAAVVIDLRSEVNKVERHTKNYHSRGLQMLGLFRVGGDLGNGPLLFPE